MKENSIIECTTVIEKESRKLLEVAEATRIEMNDYYPRLLDDECTEDAREKADSLKRATSNITKALTQTYVISDELNARLKDINKQKKGKRLHISAPANAAIDLSESRADHFAKGINIYKLLLICFTGSFVGVVIELIWCLITHGYLESRSGLVYGPFNLLY